MLLLYFINKSGLRLFHAGFGEIIFLKWHNVSNSNSWFLEILNGFSAEGLPLFKLRFFVKIKKCFNLTKTDISCVKSQVMSESQTHSRPPTRINLMQTVGRFEMQESDPLPENFLILVLQLSNHKTNQKQLGKLKCNKNQKFHSYLGNF